MKPEKTKKLQASANGKKVSSSNTVKSDEPTKEKTIKIRCEANGAEFTKQTMSSFTSLNNLTKEIISKDMNYGRSFQPQSTIPVKPIPQRHNGSKLGFLMSAFKIQNEAKNTNGLDENLYKKRDEKAYSKNLEQILSQENYSLWSSNRNEIHGNVQDTLNAILSMNGGRINIPDLENGGMNSTKFKISTAVDERRSSSEVEDNSRLKTPSKQKYKRV